MKEKFKKLTSNLWFIISVVSLVMLLIDNREEIKALWKSMLERESYIKFKDEAINTFSTYTDKTSRIVDKAKEIIKE